MRRTSHIKLIKMVVTNRFKPFVKRLFDNRQLAKDGKCQTLSHLHCIR